MRKAFVIITIINLLRLILIPLSNRLPIEWLQAVMDIKNAHSPNSIIQYLSSGLQLVGIKSIISFQLLFFAISLITQWALYVFVSKIIRTDRKLIAWVAISSTILITLFTVLPFVDGLVGLFWVLALLTFYNAIFENDNKSWLLSGLFMGLTCLLKLSGIALPVGLFVFLIFSSRFRYHLFKIGPYLSIVIATLLSMPIWLGNIETENASVAIGFANSFLTSFGYSFNSFTSFILFQFLLIFPVLYVGLWWVTFKYLARIFNKPNQVNAEFWFLLSFFLPLFLGFHLIALFDWVDMLGLAPIYLTGLVVFLKLSKKRWFTISFVLALVFHIFFIASLVL